MHESLVRRAEVHAALGDPVRLAIADLLVCSDRSPGEIASLTGLASNLLAHHLGVLEAAGVVQRSASASDGRRRYVRLAIAEPAVFLRPPRPPDHVLFLCTRNSARSQLAAALWTARTGRPATSAGTDPAPRIHRGALAAAGRARIPMEDGAPALLGHIPAQAQVITVCDRAHETLRPPQDWWHWSIVDPADTPTSAGFDQALHELDRRIAMFTGFATDHRESE
jgi:protein-tyrosine-phosphatase